MATTAASAPSATASTEHADGLQSRAILASITTFSTTFPSFSSHELTITPDPTSPATLSVFPLALIETPQPRDDTKEQW